MTAKRQNVPAQALAPLTHGGRSEVALAPAVRYQKQALLKRLGLRQSELSFAGRETLDLYARSRAKLEAIDRWLLDHAMLDEDGRPAPCMQLYTTLLNTSARALGELRAVIAELAREDDRFDAALTALAAEGRRIRNDKEPTTDA